jgi:hypothetical protein
MLAYPGLTPADIDNMDCVTQQLLQTIINTRNHMAELERKKEEGGAKGQSMLPEGVVFQGDHPK